MKYKIKKIKCLILKKEHINMILEERIKLQLCLFINNFFLWGKTDFIVLFKIYIYFVFSLVFKNNIHIKINSV